MKKQEMLEVTVANIGKRLAAREMLDCDGAERLMFAINDLTRIMFLSSLPEERFSETHGYTEMLDNIYHCWAEFDDAEPF